MKIGMSAWPPSWWPAETWPGSAGCRSLITSERWSVAEEKGRSLEAWTTDGYHPNPTGHQDLASAMTPVLLEALRPDTPRIPFTTRVDTVLEHDDGKFLWYHPRVTAIPPTNGTGNPNILMTLQKHLNVSDHYSGLSMMQSQDLGKTWTGPDAVAELDWKSEPGGVDVAVADVTPGWHSPTGKVLAVGGPGAAQQERAHSRTNLDPTRPPMRCMTRNRANGPPGGDSSSRPAIPSTWPAAPWLSSWSNPTDRCSSPSTSVARQRFLLP